MEKINWELKMKQVLALILVAFAVNFSINACSSYEAQVIAKVDRVETDSMTYCKAYFSTESFEMYNSHILCPLDQQEVLAEGVNLPLQNGHDCKVSKGDVISGILYTKFGKIFVD